MNSSAPPAQPLEAQLSSVWRVELSTAGQIEEQSKKKGPAAAAADAQVAERRDQLSRDLVPGELLVQIDVEAGRFVQTLRDAATNEVVWRYPNEAQLAFSRGVNAYKRAAAS